MARIKYPSMIDLENEIIFDIDESNFETDFFYLLTKHVIFNLRNDATETLKEIIVSGSKAKIILKKQKEEQSTTPKSVNKKLYDLLNALKPFINTNYGIDQETFDKLNEKSVVLFEEANKQYKINASLKLNAGIDYEIAKSLQPYIFGFFNKFTQSIQETERDNWVCLIFDHIGLKYHTPENGTDRFRNTYIFGMDQKE